MHNPALAVRRITLVSVAALAMVWSFVGYDLWALAGAAGDGGTVGWMVPARLPLVMAVVLSLLLLFGLNLLGRSLLRAQQRIELDGKIIAHTSEAMMLTDEGLKILAVNPAFERITGFSAAEVLGQTPRILGSGRHDAGFYRAMWQSIDEQGYWEGEVWDRARGGEIAPRQLRITAIRNVGEGRPTHYVGIFTDISAHKAQEARIEYLAHHDPLTGLPNRASLAVYLDRALAAAQRGGGRFAVLVLDLDNFKMVNDSLGHHAGDHLLCEVARRLHRVAGPGDHVIRLGGDEFVLIVEDIDDAGAVIEKLHFLMPAINETCVIDGHQLHITPSIGISLYPDDGETSEALMRNADTAMYYAKSSGRNNYQFFAAPMNAAANKRLHLENELWQALAENQLLLHYQPQVDLPSGRIVGVEALVRWQHPQRGMVPPDDFIPVAEESGLILPLGHWVLLTACRQARAWLDQGLDMGEIAVNISAHQFKQPEFVQSVRAVLAETGLPAERLELEITESTVMHSADSSVATLAELKAMGLKLAIDDFGTGYSSLAYLRRFPIDRLKIDRAFVADLESDADAASLVASIIALGNSLGLRLVAEGVENSAQAEFLRDMACECGQGYHFHRPVLAEQLSFLGSLQRLAGQPA